MPGNEISNEYFEWLYNLVCGKRYSKRISYRKVLMFLHSVEFRYSIPADANRAKDGEDLRYRFALDHDLSVRMVYQSIDRPCSVFEMMVALAIRCEETIMDNPRVGDRSGQWFWEMIVNLGLGSMLDSSFDKKRVETAVKKFLDREYESNGKGGLFTIRRCEYDLRTVEIWYQLCWYLDSIT